MADNTNEDVLADVDVIETESQIDEEIKDVRTPTKLTDTAFKEAEEKRIKLYTDIQALNAEMNAAADKGEFDAEKDAQWHAMMSDFDAVDATLQAHNEFVRRIENRNKELERRKESMASLPKEIRNRIAGGQIDRDFDETLGTNDLVKRNRIANLAVAGAFRGMGGFETKISKEERDAMDAAGFDYRDRDGIPLQLSDNWMFQELQEIYRDEVGCSRFTNNADTLRRNAKRRFSDALSTETGGGGPTSENYLFGTTFAGLVEEAILSKGEMRMFIDIARTPDGTPYYAGMADDTANSGEMLAESLAEPSATTVTFADPSFTRMKLDAYPCSSKAVVISHQLLRDNSIGLQTKLPTMLGTRLGRLFNNKYTLGAGTTEADGIVPESTLGKTAATNSAITFLELADLIESIEYGIRQTRTCRFMFNSATCNYLRKSVDLEDRPLWQVDVRSSLPQMIWGHEFVINQDMASIGSATKTVIFGDLMSYKGREVQTIRTRRLVEIRALNDQEVFVSFAEFDGRLLDPGDNPVKHLIQAA